MTPTGPGRDDRQKRVSRRRIAGADPSAESILKRLGDIHLNMTFPSQADSIYAMRDQSLSMAFVVAVGSGICWLTGRRCRGGYRSERAP